jgi:hypothetical protein
VKNRKTIAQHRLEEADTYFACEKTSARVSHHKEAKKEFTADSKCKDPSDYYRVSRASSRVIGYVKKPN